MAGNKDWQTAMSPDREKHRRFRLIFRLVRPSDLTTLEEIFPEPALNHAAAQEPQTRLALRFYVAILHKGSTSEMVGVGHLRYSVNPPSTHSSTPDSLLPEISNVFVRQEFRNLGIGTRLVGQMEKDARGLPGHPTKIYVALRPSDTTARFFWSKLYYGPPGTDGEPLALQSDEPGSATDATVDAAGLVTDSASCLVKNLPSSLNLGLCLGGA